MKMNIEIFGNRDPSARWIFFDPAPPRFALQRRNSRFALKQSSLRALRCGGRVPRKISNARFRDPISKSRKDLALLKK